MVIRPSNPESSRRLSAPGTEASPAQPALRRDAKPADAAAGAAATPAHDSAEVSSAAQQLFERTSDVAPASGSLSPERTKAVLARIKDGHYDRPEVLDQVARKLQAELDGPGTDA